MTAYDEQRLAELIKALPPAPQAWVEAAQELPLVRGRLDDIVARAEADLAFRDALIANLEEALRLEGYEPDDDPARRAAPPPRELAHADRSPASFSPPSAAPSVRVLLLGEKKGAACVAARFQGGPGVLRPHSGNQS